VGEQPVSTPATAPTSTRRRSSALTIRQRFGALDGLHIGIVGDIRHSRVARSDVFAFSVLGAEVTLVGPRTLLPIHNAGGRGRRRRPGRRTVELDVVYLLRVQKSGAGPRYSRRCPVHGPVRDGAGAFARLKPHAIVLHPGPMNRGVEIAGEVADDERSLILDQVANGVAVRMAVLFRLLGGEHDE
jgi:aspartate carbamoyltransferase catalytic subunit